MQAAKRSALIVGNGPQAREYAKLFREGLGFEFGVCGPVPAEINRFRVEEGARSAVPLDQLDEAVVGEFDFVVAVTSPNSLGHVVERLLALGAKALLIEKPVALSLRQLAKLRDLALRSGAFCRVAYNRRYYRSVSKLKSILAEEPPVQAFFDFTELSRRIKEPGRAQETTERWALVNSCHVVDTVTFLLGNFKPSYMHHAGADLLDWHKASATFAGLGFCGNAPVAYATSWLCPGRWNIEIMSANGRYKLSPLERLQAMRHDSFEWREIDAGYDIDVKFKPGLFHMVQAFDNSRTRGGDRYGHAYCELPTLGENEVLASLIFKMAGYQE
jgi:predicted dehydrogenase